MTTRDMQAALRASGVSALRTVAPGTRPGLLITPVGLDWQDRALCTQTDPEAFFPDKGGSTRQAKRVCRACDVRPECLRYALENDEHGIWGGLSERERRRLPRENAA